MKPFSTIVALFFASPVPSSEEALIFVDSERIKEIAFSAVYEKHPDTLPNDLVSIPLGIHLFCPSAWYVEEIHASQAEIPPFIDPLSVSTGGNPPCTASLPIEFRSTITEAGWVDEFGRCRLARTRQSVTVYVYEDGLATVGRLGIGGGDNSVECTEAFQDAPVCSDNPLKNPDACITGAGTFTDLADSSEAPAQAEPGFDLGLPLASSAKADETAPFHVDVDRILEIATAAVYERYPELPPDDLDSGQGLFVLCPATPSPEPAAEAAPFSCFAQISSFLKSTVVEGAYAGFDGNCETAKRGEQVQVQVTESGRVHVSRGQGVECTKAFAE